VSLGIAFKGAEGVVLAADSRVTLMTEKSQPGPPQVRYIVPATFDNASKLLFVPSQKWVGTVTFGVGAVGGAEPRTAASFLPEFEKELEGEARLTVEEFARRLGAFYQRQWEANMPKAVPKGNDMVFLVGGYDEGAPYGRLFALSVPSAPTPVEQQAGQNFGALWGGQKAHADRLVQGFDDMGLAAVKAHLGLNDEQVVGLREYLRQHNPLPLPFQFLPLQDCVDFCVLLIRTTINMQRFTLDVRGVGGQIDVATVTRTDGFKAIQQKAVVAEKEHE
jgi:hypothetical protein